jgi:hypothetical protein
MGEIPPLSLGRFLRGFSRFLWLSGIFDLALKTDMFEEKDILLCHMEGLIGNRLNFWSIYRSKAAALASNGRCIVLRFMIHIRMANRGQISDWVQNE